MEYSFTRYLLSKQSVDDRALNRVVLETLKINLPVEPIRIIEVGAGIGTMLKRLLHWNIIHKAEYVLVDDMAENIEYAQEWIPLWASESDLSVERISEKQLRVFDSTHNVRVRLEQADVILFNTCIRLYPNESCACRFNDRSCLSGSVAHAQKHAENSFTCQEPSLVDDQLRWPDIIRTSH